MPAYDKQFYDAIRESSRHAARTIVPMILEMTGPISSAIDIGCGNGIWLSVLRELGVEQTTGLDGDHVDRSDLEIPDEDFISANLNLPLPISGRYDLAITLEVVEHLPKDRAETIVDDLVALAPVIVFSAAVPHQSGEGHINEEWQHVWAERFLARGYRTLDSIRSRIWLDQTVSWWYQQNLLVFASLEEITRNARLAEAADRTDPARLSLIHPRLFLDRHELAVRIYEERAQLIDEIAALKAQYGLLNVLDP